MILQHVESITIQCINSHNILVSSDCHPKIADFGFAIQIQKKFGVGKTRTLCTAPAIARTDGYCAPEVLVGKYSLKRDVYSYGIVYVNWITYAYTMYTCNIITFHAIRWYLKLTGLKAYDEDRGDDASVVIYGTSLHGMYNRLTIYFCSLTMLRRNYIIWTCLWTSKIHVFLLYVIECCLTRYTKLSVYQPKN